MKIFVHLQLYLCKTKEKNCVAQTPSVEKKHFSSSFIPCNNTHRMTQFYQRHLLVVTFHLCFSVQRPLMGTLEERAVNSGSGAWGDFETWQHGLFEMHLVRFCSCLGALMNRNLSKTMERRDLAVVTLNL